MTLRSRFLIAGYSPKTDDHQGYFTERGTLAYDPSRALWFVHEQTALEEIERLQLETRPGWADYIWVVEEVKPQDLAAARANGTETSDDERRPPNADKINTGDMHRGGGTKKPAVMPAVVDSRPATAVSSSRATDTASTATPAPKSAVKTKAATVSRPDEEEEEEPAEEEQDDSSVDVDVDVDVATAADVTNTIHTKDDMNDMNTQTATKTKTAPPPMPRSSGKHTTPTPKKIAAVSRPADAPARPTRKVGTISGGLKTAIAKRVGQKRGIATIARPAKKAKAAPAALPVAPAKERVTKKAKPASKAAQHRLKMKEKYGDKKRPTRRVAPVRRAAPDTTVGKYACLCGCDGRTDKFFLRGHVSRFNGYLTRIAEGSAKPGDYFDKATIKLMGPWKETRRGGLKPAVSDCLKLRPELKKVARR